MWVNLFFFLIFLIHNTHYLKVKTDKYKKNKDTKIKKKNPPRKNSDFFVLQSIQLAVESDSQRQSWSLKLFALIFPAT